MKRVILVSLQVLVFLMLVEGSFRLRSYFQPGPSITPANQGERRLLVIGDSISLTWPTRLQELLSHQDPHRNWRVINVARPATRTSDALHDLPGLLEKWRPDVVVTMIGKSDVLLGDKPSLLNSTFRSSRLFLMFGERLKRTWNYVRLETMDWCKRISFLGESLPTHFALAQLHNEAGDFPRALGHYRKAIQLWEQSSRPSQYLSDAVIAYSEVASIAWFSPEAIASLDKARVLLNQISVRKVSDDRTSWAAGKLGYAYLKNGDTKMAEKWLRFSLELDAGNFFSTRELAWTYYSQKNWNKAEDMFERVVLRDPNYVRGLGALAESYRHTGDFSRGTGFLQGLMPKSSIPNVVADHVLGLELKIGQGDQDLKSTPSQLGSHAQYLSNLSYLNTVGKKTELDDIFVNYVVDDVPSQFSMWRYRDLVKRAADAQVPVIALQYPSNGVESLRRTLAGVEENVIFLDVHAGIIRAMRANGRHASDFLLEDFEHLTDAGSDVVAHLVMDAANYNLRQ